jgi:hypothetical protein
MECQLNFIFIESYFGYFPESRRPLHGRWTLQPIITMRRYKIVKMSAAESGRRVGGAAEGPNIAVNYMGYAVKQDQ